MNARFLFSLIVVLLLCHISFAQYNFKGITLNNNNEPVAFAVVSSMNLKDSSVMSNVMSDSSGNFVLSFPDKDNKAIRITATGYVTLTGTIETSADQPQQPVVFRLMPDDKHLEEITVSANRPLFERKTDRVVYHVSASITAIGGNALDAVKKAPGVMIQQKDYAINLIGKSGVLILVNDRLLQLSGEDLFAYLQGIPSDNIDRIEVITAPPAQYDASGNSGLINIVLKKNNRPGINGNIRAGYEQAFWGKGIAGGDINYRKGKLSLYGNASYTQGANQIAESLATPYPGQLFQVNDDYKRVMKPFQYTAALDYDIHKNGIIGIQWISNNANRQDISDNLIKVYTIPEGTIDSTMATKGDARRTNSNNVLNLNYTWNIDTAGRKLTINANRLWFNGKRISDFTTTHYAFNGLPTGVQTSNASDGSQDIDITTAQADLELPLRFANLSAGAKLSFIHNESDNRFGFFDQSGYHEDPAISNSFTYSEKVQALYISAQKTMGKWSFQAGLRGEFTQTRGYALNLNQTNTNQYFNMFPTAYILYQMNEAHSWTINYSKRINRPDYRSLDPFRAYATPYHYGEGNPFLLPAFNHNLELAYTFKGRYTLSAFYQMERNHFGSVWMTDPVRNVTSGVSRNFADFVSYGVYASGSLQPLAWWEIQVQLGVQERQLRSKVYTGTVQSYNNLSGYLGINQNFACNPSKTLLAELNAYYITRYREDFLEIKGLGSVDLGLKVLLLKKKLTAGLSIADLLATQRAKGLHVVTGQTINNYFDTRNFRLTLNYKFGSNKIKGRRERDIGIEEEKGRAG